MFDRLRSAVATLERCARELQVTCVEGPDAVRLVELVGRGERVCAAMKGMAAARVAETGVWRHDGSRSAGHWLAEKSGTSLGAAQQALATARAVEDLPDVEAAYRAGELSEVQAGEITSAASSDPAAAERLLEAAQTSSMKGLRDRCREVRAGAEADDAAWARRLHRNRRAHHWTDPDGTVRVDARLAPEEGARFVSALDAHQEVIFGAARKAGSREPYAAYAADALVALAIEGPCRPSELNVNVDATALQRGHTVPGERCEIPGIGPIPVTTARRLVGDSKISLMLRDGQKCASVGRPVRTIPAKLRRELDARFPVCGVSGCDQDRFLEIDHVIPIAEGGATDTTNVWRICSHHHKLKHHEGWVVVGGVGGWDLVPP